MSTPSPGAMRAAKALFGDDKRYIPGSGWGDPGALAEMIDRETGVAELLTACKLVTRCGNSGARLSREASDAVRSALAKHTQP